MSSNSADYQKAYRNSHLGRDAEIQHMSYRKRAERNRWLIDAIKKTPCADCGQTFPPCCMDFDHVAGSKRFNIGGMINHSTRKIVEEIAKCDIVCANCHRIRTHLT